MKNKKGKSEDSVGYGTPPRQNRFKPGQSGNPTGRPKKRTIDILDRLDRELSGLITISGHGKPQRIPKVRGILMQLTNKALKGDLKAITLVIRLLEPRAAEQTDNLSPVLREMRAIHARHGAAIQNLANNTENDSGEKN